MAKLSTGVACVAAYPTLCESWKVALLVALVEERSAAHRAVAVFRAASFLLWCPAQTEPTTLALLDAAASQCSRSKGSHRIIQLYHKV